MRLHKVTVGQWRQFKKPVTVEGMKPGINVIAGPNESGKSTLAEAIQAAFFAFHNSTAQDIRRIQPWSDSSARPSVSLTFYWKEQKWHLEKRLLGQGRFDLSIDEESYSGTEAEQKLAELMNYREGRRGMLHVKDRGIPGLLWVGQGKIQELKEPVGNASTYLQKELSHDLGEIASSDGDWLINKVTEERKKIFTAKGDLRIEFKSMEDRLQELRQEEEALEAQLESYGEKVDLLGLMQKEHQKEEASKPWKKQYEKAQAAKNELDEVARIIDDRERAEIALHNCNRELKHLYDKLKALESDEERLVEQRVKKERAANDLEALRHRKDEVVAKLGRAQSFFETTQKALVQVEQQADRKKLESEYIECKKTLEKMRESLKNAEKLRLELASKTALQQSQFMSPESLEELEGLKKKLDEIEIKKQALATRLAWALEPDQSMMVDGDTASGQGEQLLLKETNVDIKGFGCLKITPGGEDAGELANSEDRYRSEFRNKLAKMGVKDLADAKRRTREHEQREHDISIINVRIEGLAPEGVEALKDKIEQSSNKLKVLKKRISECPPEQTGLPSLQEAEHEHARAQEELVRLKGELQKHDIEKARVNSNFLNIKEEFGRLKSEIESTAWQKDKKRLMHELTNARAEKETLESKVESLLKRINEADPAQLQNDVERYKKSANMLEREAGQRRENIARLEAELETLGAQGLEEYLGEQRIKISNLERRLEEVRSRAHVLGFLKDLLEKERQALVNRLQKPLQERLNHYLPLLFDDTRMEIDENLLPNQLLRDNLSEGFDELSYGAREQLGLISRLAYADLLKNAGKPALIILDDALVHSDSDRLEQMKRIVYDASQRHQILLFTCHPQNWKDVGAAAWFDLEELKRAS